MTVRNLDAIFKPRSVALIGASERERSVGRVVARNLREGGFEGPLYLVNRRGPTVDGARTFTSIADLPEAPDLGVVCTPPNTVPQAIAELGARGTRGAVVITAGFGEGSELGRSLRRQMLEAARPHLLRIVGPNCVGIMLGACGLNASFAHRQAKPGHLAFVTQSGAILVGVVDWAAGRDIGFSHLISIGDMADVDFGDLLDYLGADPEVSAILLYVEGVTQARKFMSAARAASRQKPVIVMKSGRHEEGARAAHSHTGALAGADAVYDAAFRRAGMVRVATLDELFDAVQILAKVPRVGGDRLAIVTNGGGFGVLATDALIDRHGRLAELAPATVGKLDRVLPATWSRANPVDIIGDADGPRYAATLAAVLADEGVDAVLALNCPTAVATSTEAAEAVAAAVGPQPPVPVLAGWIGDSEEAMAARRHLATAGIPTYSTPEEAVAGFMHLVNYRRGQETIMRTPPSVPTDFAVDPQAAEREVTKALAERREWLSEPEAKAVLAAYGIPVAATEVARTPEQAADVARRIGRPVAMKILSYDITHKSDVGGVALNLGGPEEVLAAARGMLERVARLRPEARIEGVVVQEMIVRPGAYELICGVVADPQFGPVVLFGQGGVAVEVLGDRALALPPLDLRLARDLMADTRVHRLLMGFRNRPAVDLDGVALTLVKLSQLIVDRPEIAELDINPLLADEHGVVALDARIRVERPALPGDGRLAIRPYPRELEADVETPDGTCLRLRPIRPEDEPTLQRMFGRLSPEAVRLRFFAPMKALTHRMAARLTQIDYDREMAFVLAEAGLPGEAPLHGVARFTADPDNERAEFAVIVEDALAGRGYGALLMRRIIEHARTRGIRTLFGNVLRENRAMLELAVRLGFRREADPEDPHVVVVTLELATAA